MPKASEEEIQELREAVVIVAPHLIEVWKAIWSNDPEWLTKAVTDLFVAANDADLLPER